MTPIEIGTIFGPMLLTVGGIATAFYRRLEKLEDRVCEAEKEARTVHGKYQSLLVLTQRWRIAFQIVAAELQRYDTASHTLSIARSMLRNAPVEDMADPTLDPLKDMPPDMEAMLNKVQQDVRG